MHNYLSIIIIYCCVFYSTQSIAQIQKIELTLEQTLNIIGKSEKIFFTIESGYGQNQAINSFQQQRSGLYNSDDGINLNSLTIASENVGNKFVVIQSSVKSNVYHVIDVRLRNPNANPMDEHASNVSFKGPTYLLVEEVGRMNPHFEAIYLFDSRSQPPFAFWLNADIQATDLSFRELFTNAIDLSEKLASILWVSQTNLDTQKTSIYYY